MKLRAEQPGLIPTTAWKKAALGQSWQKGETLVCGIGQGYVLATPLPVPVNTVRRAHIATATIQELLCGPAVVLPSPAPPPPPPPPLPSGPTVTGLTEVEQGFQLTTSRPLDAASVAPAAFSVSDFSGTTGWTPLTIASAVLQGDGSVLVALAAPTRGVLVRFIAHGSGPTPLLAADDHAPLGAPSASGADDGIDFVQMIARS